MQESIKNTLEALEKNHIKASYFENAQEAVQALFQEINSDQRVGVGGSVTINSLEIPQKLKARGNQVFCHWLENTPEKMEEARKNAATCDVYLTSTNAITQKGQLVNIDGLGNRVTAMIYGPKKVIVLCGINKITANLDDAMERIKANAYKNARRLKRNTPCAITEKCADCQSPERMCNVTTIINKKPSRTEMEVYLIGEELGY